MGSSGCVRHPKSERKKPNRLKGNNHENNNHKNNPDRRPAALRPGFCRRRGEKACRGRPSAFRQDLHLQTIRRHTAQYGNLLPAESRPGEVESAGHDPLPRRRLVRRHAGSVPRRLPYFSSRGLVCATAEYRMLGKGESAKLPKGESRKRVCVTDAKGAIRWFKQHAGELGIDPNRIITGGGSAGGHITPGHHEPRASTIPPIRRASTRASSPTSGSTPPLPPMTTRIPRSMSCAISRPICRPRLPSSAAKTDGRKAGTSPTRSGKPWARKPSISRSPPARRTVFSLQNHGAPSPSSRPTGFWSSRACSRASRPSKPRPRAKNSFRLQNSTHRAKKFLLRKASTPSVGWVERSEPHHFSRADYYGGARCARPTLLFWQARRPRRERSQGLSSNDLAAAVRRCRSAARRALPRLPCSLRSSTPAAVHLLPV